MTHDAWVTSHPYLQPVAFLHAQVNHDIAASTATNLELPPWEDYIRDFVAGVPLLHSSAVAIDYRPVEKIIRSNVERLTASPMPQIADEIKGLIARGSLSEGMALPPVRQVADDLGVNLNTIAAAYRELQKEGLLTVRHGSGAVVSSRRIAQQSDADLRKALRASLAHLALAGLPRAEILEIVNEEVRDLFRREANP